MPVNDVSRPGNEGGRPPRAKRVGRACDYCRKKRLKCTAEQQPCMNCLLYHATCVFSTQPRNVPAVQEGEESPPKRRKISSQTRASPKKSAKSSAAEPAEHVQASNNSIFGESYNDSDGAIQVQVPVWRNGFSHSPDLEPPPDFWTTDSQFQDALGMEMGDGPKAPQASNLLYEIDNTFDPSQAPMLYPDGSMQPLPSRSAVVPQDSQSRTPTIVQQHDSAAGDGQILPGLFLNHDDETCGFIASNSNDATIVACLKPFLLDQQWMQEIYAAKSLPGREEDGFSSPTGLQCGFFPPERHLAEIGVNAYFRNVHLIYPVFDESLFRWEWEYFYDTAQPAPDAVRSQIIYLVIAIGLSSDPNLERAKTRAQQMAQDLHQRAWAMFPNLLIHQSLSAMQAMVLHVNHLVQLGRIETAWAICGLNIRMAQSIGLHRQPPEGLGLSQKTVNIRSRLWWTIYCHDAFLSVSQGRPTVTEDSPSNIDICALEPNEVVAFEDQNLASMVFCWHVQLSQIEHRLGGVLCIERHKDTFLQGLAGLDAALLGWRDHIPIEYQPDQENIASPSLFHHVALLHFRYFGLLRGVHWASMMFHSVDLAVYPRLRSSEAICVAAVRSLIRTLNDMSNETTGKKVMPSAFSDQYMVAIAILFRNICRYPKRVSTQGDLAYLQAARHHLEHDTNSFQPKWRALVHRLCSDADAIAAKQPETSAIS